MATKPYFGHHYMDKNKSFEENYGNYRRDLLLWEQAEAMEKMQKAQEEALRNSQISNRGSSTYSNYTTDYDNSSDDYKLFEIDRDIHSIEVDKEILGKKIDSRIETLCSKIKDKMKIIEFWAKVKETILMLIVLAVSFGWIAIAIFIDDIYSSNFIKNCIIMCTVSIIVLFIFSNININRTKIEIFRLYEEKKKITQEINNKKNKKHKKTN